MFTLNMTDMGNTQDPMNLVVLCEKFNFDSDGFAITSVIHIKDHSVIEILKLTFQKGQLEVHQSICTGEFNYYRIAHQLFK